MKQAQLVFCALFVTSCGGPQPLIFVSSTSVGLDVSAGAANSPPLTFALGVKLNDASFVPVSILDTTGNVHEIRGCGSTGVGTGTAPPCSNFGANAAGTNAQASAASTAASGGTLSPVVMKALPVNTANGSESLRDSLSVYSSFNNSDSAANATSGGPSVAISLGKVFATGVAAQQLTQGQNYMLQKGTIAQCVAQLATAMGPGKVTEAALTTCKGQ